MDRRRLLAGFAASAAALALQPEAGGASGAAPGDPGLDRLLGRLPAGSRNWLLIPRVGLTAQIVEGTDDISLGKGVGRYPTTARIGEQGIVGLAGHRTSRPAPFRRLDSLSVGDTIAVATRTEVFRYATEQMGPGRAHRVVTPDAVEVLDERGYDGLTLTTCTPPGSVKFRLVVFGRLEERFPRIRT